MFWKTLNLCKMEAAKPWHEKAVEKVERDLALGSLRDVRQAAHAMIYSTSDNMLFGRIPMRYSILMVMRFDGNLGFPGGLIDVTSGNEGMEEGLNRELMEEINLDKKFLVTDKDYFGSYSQQVEKMKFMNHFYLKKVSENEFEQIEKDSLNSVEWGMETLGIVKVPVQRGTGIGRTHLPIVDFLQNKFIGSARQQLVEGIVHAGIFSENEMMKFFTQLSAIATSKE